MASLALVNMDFIQTTLTNLFAPMTPTHSSSDRRPPLDVPCHCLSEMTCFAFFHSLMMGLKVQTPAEVNLSTFLAPQRRLGSC